MKTVWLEKEDNFSQISENVVFVKSAYVIYEWSLSENQRDKMWFDLLDSLMKPQNNNQADLKSLIKHVLTSSMGHISLHRCVVQVIQP